MPQSLQNNADVSRETPTLLAERYEQALAVKASRAKGKRVEKEPAEFAYRPKLAPLALPDEVWIIAIEVLPREFEVSVISRIGVDRNMHKWPTRASFERLCAALENLHTAMPSALYGLRISKSPDCP